MRVAKRYQIIFLSNLYFQVDLFTIAEAALSCRAKCIIQQADNLKINRFINVTSFSPHYVRVIVKGSIRNLDTFKSCFHSICDNRSRYFINRFVFNHFLGQFGFFVIYIGLGLNQVRQEQDMIIMREKRKTFL